MIDGMVALEAWINTALAALAPAERRRMFREIGRELRARNARRMAAQTDPEGRPWTPRHPRREKNSHGKVRRAARMMMKIRAARRLKADSTDTGAEIAFTGRSATIAAVHHFGGVDHVDKAHSDTKARYPARPLLGLPEADIAYVRDTILRHLSERLS